MTRRTLVAAVTGLLLTGAPALAAERGVVIGEHVFGPLACGIPQIARAPFADPLDLAGSDPTTCTIVLNRRYAKQMPSDMRCTLVLHEYGHLAGRPHSDNPDSVMYPVYQGPDERCVSTAPAARGTSGTARRSG